MVRRHVPVSHKVKHQDELRSITAKLIKIDKLEARYVYYFFQTRLRVRTALQDKSSFREFRKKTERI